MSGFASLFSEMNFRNTIQKYASQNGWKIADLSDRHASLRFGMSSGRTQTCHILRYDTTLEFSCQSAVFFDSESQIPHALSTLLLKRSAQRKVGFWCIEELSGKQVYSCMHNAEMSLLDSNYFASVVRALINECDDFETSMLQLMRS